MEEFNASAGTQAGPEDRAVSAALDAGRLGGVLLQLQRERFDGVLNFACEGQAASIGFREGSPVTFDDPTPGHTLADQFVEREQLTRGQCNKVLARMTDALVDNEAVAFCEQAVQLGFLTEDEAKVELSSRIRAHMIQLFGWRACESSLTPGVAALLDRPEYPQNVGAILYMGVRTFYDEELLISCHPDLTQTYVRLTAAPATIVQFFGLDDEEFQLLRRIQPDDPASLLVETRKVERVHLLALLLLLRMAQFCEVFKHPQPRATSPRMQHPRSPREREPTGPVREDRSVARRFDLPREEGSVARRPADSSRDDRSGSRADQLPREGRPVTRNDRSGSRAGQLPRDERSASQAGQLPRDERSASRAGQLPRDERSASQAGRLPRDERSASQAGQFPRDDRSGSRAEPLPRDERSASQAGQFPRDDHARARDRSPTRRVDELPRGYSFARGAEQPPRDERSTARDRSPTRKADELARDDQPSSASEQTHEDHSFAGLAEEVSSNDNPSARSSAKQARDERSAARDRSPTRKADELPRNSPSGAHREPAREDDSFAGLAEELSRDDNAFVRSARQERDGSAARSADELLRDERSARNRSGAREASTDDHSFAGLGEELSRDDSSFASRTAARRADEHSARGGSAARRADELPRAEPSAGDARPVTRMASTPPEPEPVQSARTQGAQPLQTPPSPQQQVARSPLLDPPAPGRSARPTVDATQEALLEAAARTARMRRSLPARRHSKQADAVPGPAAEGGNSATKSQAAPVTYTNAYATKSGSFDPSKSGSFDPSKSGSFDPSKSGSFDPSKTGPTDTRPEYAKAHLKELIARHKQTANAPDTSTANSQRNPARELREARALLHAQHFARAEKVLSGLVELEPVNELYKTYHLWARWRAQPEVAESVVGELQELAKKLVSDAEHGGFAAYILGHVFFHNKRDDLAEKFFKRAHAADRSNKDAERHLMILERRKQSAADGSNANRKLFGIQLPNKPKP
jgi:hypothetical protein